MGASQARANVHKFSGPHSCEGWAAVLIATAALKGCRVSVFHVTVNATTTTIQMEGGTMLDSDIHTTATVLINAAKEMKMPCKLEILAFDTEYSYTSS